MAIIDKDTRMTVATRLANLNYKEQMDSSLAKLNELFEKYIIGKTPDDVLKCFKAHKKFFIRCNEPSLSSYNLPKTFFPEDWGSRGFYMVLIYISTLERLESGNPRTSLFCLFNVSSLCPTQSQSIPKT